MPDQISDLARLGPLSIQETFKASSRQFQANVQAWFTAVPSSMPGFPGTGGRPRPCGIPDHLHQYSMLS